LGGEQDLRNMGGLRKKIPITFWTILAAGVAIAGVPPFSGFHSKDEILLAAHHHAPWMYWIGVITAGMTAFYVFRAIFLAFFGEPRGHHHPHESPFVMTGPLMILAVLSLAGGYIPVPEILEPIFGRPEGEHDQTLVLISVLAGFSGIALAWLMYVAKPDLAGAMAERMGGLYRLVYNKYFVDEIYDAAVVHPIEHGSRVVLWRGMDTGLIDRIVNGIGSRSSRLGDVLRRLQSGNIRTYAAWVVVGSVVVIIAIGLTAGGDVR
jgi:NADH-quinone oxidoreductase subunit L